MLFYRPFNKCEKDDTFKMGQPIIPKQKIAYETKNEALFRPAVNSISDNEIKSRKMYRTNEKSKPYLSFGMLLLKS